MQATLEMQQAAREVAVENDRLRKLLMLKGVGDAEVAAFLGDFDKQWSDEPAKRKRKRGETQGDQMVSKARQPGSPRPTAALQPLPADCTNQQSGGLSILADVVTQSKCCNGQTQCSDTNGDDVSSYKVLAEHTSTSAGPSQAPAQTKDINDLSSSTTMSCIAAAQIVADLQGHGDNERARQSLGCCDEGECTVKNTAVFQIMDRG